MMREVKEETGLTLTSYRARGVITFISNEWGIEYMHLFTADQFTGEMTDCDEGELVWVPKKEIKDLKLWEGDKIFLRSDPPLRSVRRALHSPHPSHCLPSLQYHQM